jgi:outer membrane protein OmpA-like peptidoglycan-associated protein
MTMTARLTLAFLALLALLSAGQAARADDAAERLGLELMAVVSGKGNPEIVLTPGDPVASFEARLVDTASGKGQTVRSGAIKAGMRKALPFRQALGTTAWEAEIEVAWGDGGRDRFKLEFSATRVGPLQMTMVADEVDLNGRRLAARATNPVKRVELEIFGEAGRLLAREAADFDPPVAPGEPVAIGWDVLDGEILQMKVKLTDVAGFWTGMQVSPFSVDIPHEEVEFESGKADIRASEAPKLERTLTAIGAALQKYRDLPGLALYVGGYTDTVGDAASNRALSKSRATAIARWFASRGLRLPMQVQGFGEDVLAVATGDETDEPRNRRAVYILSTYAPTGRDVPTSAWTRL